MIHDVPSFSLGLSLVSQIQKALVSSGFSFRNLLDALPAQKHSRTAKTVSTMSLYTIFIEETGPSMWLFSLIDKYVP